MRTIAAYRPSPFLDEGRSSYYKLESFAVASLVTTSMFMIFRSDFLMLGSLCQPPSTLQADKISRLSSKLPYGHQFDFIVTAARFSFFVFMFHLVRCCWIFNLRSAPNQSGCFIWIEEVFVLTWDFIVTAKSEDLLEFEFVGVSDKEITGYIYVYTTWYVRVELEFIQSNTETWCVIVGYSRVRYCTISGTAMGRPLQYILTGSVNDGLISYYMDWAIGSLYWTNKYPYSVVSH